MSKLTYRYNTTEEGAAILRSLGYISWYAEQKWVAAHLPIRHGQENYTNYGRSMWECFQFEGGSTGEKPVTGDEFEEKKAYLERHVKDMQARKDREERLKREDEEFIKEFQTSTYWKVMKKMYKKYTTMLKAFDKIDQMARRGIH